MRRVTILFLIVFAVVNLGARDLGVLLDLTNPVHMNVWQGKLFISEKSTVWVFSLTDRKLLARFGKEGEGPGEFKLGHGATAIVMDVNANHIVVNSAVRVAFFDHRGSFERQINVGPMMHMLPFGKGFISQAMIKGEGDGASQWIALFDNQGQRVRTLFNTDVAMGMGVSIQVPAHFFGYRVVGKRAFVATGKSQPEVTIFNEQGEPVDLIKLESPSHPVSEEYRRQVEQFYQRDVRYRNFWDYLKKFMVFPETFPPLRNMLVDEGRIYLLGYGQEKGKYPWISINMQGKERRDFLLVGTELSVLELAPHDIHQGIYYTLISDDEGAWHLYGERLEVTNSFTDMASAKADHPQ